MVYVLDVVVASALAYYPAALLLQAMPAELPAALADTVQRASAALLNDSPLNGTAANAAAAAAAGGVATKPQIVLGALSGVATTLTSLAWEPVGVFYALLASFVAYALWRFYQAAQSPLWVHRTPTAPRATRDQKASEFPPPFPNGWFHVCMSHHLKRGEVKELSLFGTKMVLFRAADSGAHAILDGYCPHLGANLGVAGVVHKDCLKCIFHGWEFSVKDGSVVRVAGTTTLPPAATAAGGSGLKKWHSVETNGSIFVWHDAEDRPPTWEIDPIPEINSGAYYRSGATWCHINAHVQELPENGPDSAHLNVLHQPFVWETLPSSVSHAWTAAWQPHETKPHMSAIRLTQAFCFLGRAIPGTSVVANINQIGPGIVCLRLNTPIGKLIAFEFVTPTKTTTQIVQHTMFCSTTVPRVLGKFFLWALEAQFQRDAPIWETKKFLPKPVLSKADGPIMAFRRWYQQFYSPSSVKFPEALARETMIDW